MRLNLGHTRERRPGLTDDEAKIGNLGLDPESATHGCFKKGKAGHSENRALEQKRARSFCCGGACAMRV